MPLEPVECERCGEEYHAWDPCPKCGWKWWADEGVARETRNRIRSYGMDDIKRYERESREIKFVAGDFTVKLNRARDSTGWTLQAIDKSLLGNYARSISVSDDKDFRALDTLIKLLKATKEEFERRCSIESYPVFDVVQHPPHFWITNKSRSKVWCAVCAVEQTPDNV